MSAGRRLTSCFYADDFTGAADVLLQYARAGLRARLIADPQRIQEEADRGDDLDVLGVAGVARSLPSELIADEIGPILDSFLSLEPRFIQYKVCSTFDSSCARGSIGRACEVARERFGAQRIPVLAAQPDLGRYTVFSNHFARGGDGVVYRLDEHPAMSVHPVTPARDANLVRVLADQAPGLDVRALDITQLRAEGTPAIGAGEGDVVVLDAIDNDDLARVGRDIWATYGQAPAFAVGSGGLSRGIAGQLPGAAPLPGTPAPVEVMLALAGSASPETHRQVEAAVQAGWAAFALPLSSPDPCEEILDRVVETIASGRSVVVHTASGSHSAGDLAGSVTAGDARRAITTGDAPRPTTTGDAPRPATTGDAAVSELIGDALARLLHATAAETGVRRVLVAGGDTCGSVFRKLKVDAFELVGTVSHVPMCRVTSRAPALDGIEVALKGGQIGAVDLFERTRAGVGEALR